ncbi:hypothetical protein [Paenibacillus alkalitolerans]|uniref:hypothetical protein n=1 Tax=Paenibacillus alkalitolerans TaxID=2799335 RepID=UPI0018F4F940|nr:hypothetical protein [Paenibacillus alkalitolerans]
MWSYARSGWTVARKSWFLLFLLFLYQYIWGFILFNYVKSTVEPLLHRYPGEELPEAANRLFLLESQFQLMKTDAVMPFVWAFLFFALTRMALTPIINSGLFSALHRRSETKPRIAFFQGVKRYAKPFLLLYLLQTVLTFAPLIWLIPKAIESVTGALDWQTAALGFIPYAIGWLAYQGLLELLFMYVGFGIVSGRNGLLSLGTFLRHCLPIIGLALLLFAVTGGIGLITTAASLWWAGFAAVLVHQSYPLVKALFKLWGIASQYQFWASK